MGPLEFVLIREVLRGVEGMDWLASQEPAGPH